jgi:hypothetical protein
LDSLTQDKALEFNNFLIIFGFLLFFGIISLLQSIGKAVIEFTINQNQMSSSITTVVVDFVFLTLFTTLMFLFLKKKKLFLKVYILTLLISIISHIYIYMAIQNIHFFSILLKLCIFFGLLVYFIKSKEVKQTFIN